ncbi:hypothetical protein [Sphingobacterium sp.]|uniref:hypothetical protein n=1 Tax=Sphingobacterium sp. TaxID=341027 RepID=UPI0028A9771D|nr:hypothetical protein [Sphingobacterium sp.]
MNDKNFVLLTGVAFVVICVVGLSLFLKFIKKEEYESPILDLSNLKVILALLAIGIFGLFLIFYKIF